MNVLVAKSRNKLSVLGGSKGGGGAKKKENRNLKVGPSLGMGARGGGRDIGEDVVRKRSRRKEKRAKAGMVWANEKGSDEKRGVLKSQRKKKKTPTPYVSTGGMGGWGKGRLRMSLIVWKAETYFF